ncbi:uncharacterized protein LOC129337241 isoform X2 [Eublepharis macularius]|uniref:Uncharacterized protein LOC129337241 isoform X2 n=1 Tax=Eublepharis macularius TaxID=481883 RepID=A0AA97K0K3_EUBMA|nr:uncharacterized protein LOC129337241 isoform X2 [Eublepharis macularius]
MFSSGAERERDKWGPRFDSPPSTSAAASQANATGRKRKANFSNDETETLVWNVVRHFSALYGSESFRAHPVRRKQLWTQIQSRVNFLGYTERSIDDLKHKWRDLRLDVKKKITAKKPPLVHRPGPPHKPRLTPLEKMVASTFLQPTHDSEPEIVLDPEIFFPGASKQSFMPPQPGASHPGIYIDTNGQPSSLPAMEGSTVPRLAGQSPDPSMICDYSRGEGQSSSESGTELRTPEMSAVSPPLRNESLVSYASMSEEEEQDAAEVEGGMGLQPGLESQLSAEENGKASGRQTMLIRRSNSQGSVTSLPEDPLNPADAHSDWGHDRPSDLPALGRVLGPSQPEEEETANQSAEMGSFPRMLMGPTWEKQDGEQQHSRSPLHVGALTEESLPSSESPQADRVPASQPLPRRMGCSRLREGRRETWRTNIHCLLDMEDQWDQLYHQELAMWQEERAQQREERARDRELQFRLLAVLTDIRDELRHLRQERTAARQERASQTTAPTTVPAATASPPRSDTAAAETSADPIPLFFPLKSEEGLSGPPPVSAGRGEAATATRSPRGTPRRGRGRPRGSTSKHRRLFVTNS